MKAKAKNKNTYFSDVFGVAPSDLRRYGAFNISLISDLPLFVDPFLLFNSRKEVYQDLHESIIRYLKFLRDRSVRGSVNRGLLLGWYVFSEVHQNWLGYSESGNRGSGLGRDFARALNANLNSIFADFGKEKIARGSHLEKLCLISPGVGHDKISDFTTNLIKEFLLEYTQAFGKKHIDKKLRRRVRVKRVRFNYRTESWESGEYDLPCFAGDYVLLTPHDILTKDDVWINRPDLFNEFDRIAESVSNEQLRAEVNNYFHQRLAEEPTREEWNSAVSAALRKFPSLIEYYIKYKEENGDRAREISEGKVSESEERYVRQVGILIELLRQQSGFYGISGNTLPEARARLEFLKDIIENKGGYRIFYSKGNPVRRESDLHILYRLTWFGTPSDVSREVDDGRGPADFKISRGRKGKSIVEFKLATNAQLKRNLRRQGEIYQKASDAESLLKAIIFFSEREHKRVFDILKDLNLEGCRDIILIDARADNKPSASKA
ncbi:MAG: hypothetical protein JW958_06925 [Candidatus Eisenbacteria bacterium]|nr:hypothetical protein [Candidatus Eisenbacteria bacterium]